MRTLGRRDGTARVPLPNPASVAGSLLPSFRSAKRANPASSRRAGRPLTVGCVPLLCGISDDARDAVEAKIPTTPNGVAKFFEGREAAHVVVGVGTHSRWMSQLVEVRSPSDGRGPATVEDYKRKQQQDGDGRKAGRDPTFIPGAVKGHGGVVVVRLPGGILLGTSGRESSASTSGRAATCLSQSRCGLTSTRTTRAKMAHSLGDTRARPLAPGRAQPTPSMNNADEQPIKAPTQTA
jgi:hypothetical protein